MAARALLERLYGFAEPTVTGADRLAYACLYCDMQTAAPGGPAPHAADCPYWDARAALDSPIAHRLVARLAGGAR